MEQQDPDRDSYGHLIKSQKERVQEGISLLKQLKEYGIPETEPGYLELKSHITAWIKEGKKFNDIVYFPRFGRKAEVVLPIKLGRVSSINLLAPRK
jgi:hypothetical protein